MKMQYTSETNLPDTASWRSSCHIRQSNVKTIYRTSSIFSSGPTAVTSNTSSVGGAEVKDHGIIFILKSCMFSDVPLLQCYLHRKTR